MVELYWAKALAEAREAAVQAVAAYHRAKLIDREAEPVKAGG